MAFLGLLIVGTLITLVVLTAVPWWVGLILVIVDIIKGPGIDSIIVIICYIMAIKAKRS